MHLLVITAQAFVKSELAPKPSVPRLCLRQLTHVRCYANLNYLIDKYAPFPEGAADAGMDGNDLDDEW